MTVICPNCQYHTTKNNEYRQFTSSVVYKCNNENCGMVFKVVIFKEPKEWINLEENE